MRTRKWWLVGGLVLALTSGGSALQTSARFAQDIQKPGHGSLVEDIQKPGHGSWSLAGYGIGGKIIAGFGLGGHAVTNSGIGTPTLAGFAIGGKPVA